MYVLLPMAQFYISCVVLTLSLTLMATANLTQTLALNFPTYFILY